MVKQPQSERVFVSVDQLLCGLSFHSQCFQVMPEYLFSLTCSSLVL